ncbi:RNA-guided endonuclease InsQ/TnpB family protein [Streptomyces sp. NPDC057686]|uniref:RNA-guided endonuclease InsQ/TnpB family protein n=1 Tax=Streptomyces sp. NPDC057686 TaxID=3346212 RepID=UPI003674F714
MTASPVKRAFKYRFYPTGSKYPRFKARKKCRSSAECTRSAFAFREGRLKLARMGEPLDIRWSRPLPGGSEPSTVSVSRDAAGRWFVSLLCEDTPAPITDPRHEREDRARLGKARRALARKEKNSKNRAKARHRVAKIHARIGDRRRDFLQKLSTRLVRENRTLVIEDLIVRSMVKNHELARALSDASWTGLRSMPEYKAVNLPAAGPAVTVCGDGVRPQRKTPGGQSSTKQKRQRATAGAPRPRAGDQVKV